MTTSRRSFFATMLAPFVARFLPVSEPKTEATLLDEINAATLANIYPDSVADNFFLESPFLARLRSMDPWTLADTMDGGNFLQSNFLMQDEEPTTQPTTPACLTIHNPIEKWDGAN